jgi:hypothetical protein
LDRQETDFEGVFLFRKKQGRFANRLYSAQKKLTAEVAEHAESKIAKRSMAGEKRGKAAHFQSFPEGQGGQWGFGK